MTDPSKPSVLNVQEDDGPDRNLNKHQNHPTKVQQKDKVLAACVGGMLTSLTMTPLDVVKTRLQTQNTHESVNFNSFNNQTMSNFHSEPSSSSQCLPCSRNSSSSSSFGSNQNGRLFRFGSPLINSSSSTCSTPSVCLGLSSSSSIVSQSNCNAQIVSSSHPSWIQNQPASHLHHPPTKTNFTAASGIVDSIVQIVRYEGVGTLWRGVGPALMISIPAQAAYMLGYDKLRSTLINLDPNPPTEPGSFTFYGTTLAPLSAGVIARSAIATFFSPLELIRTRVQSSPSPLYLFSRPFDHNHRISPLSSSPPQIGKALLLLIRSSGFKSLYAGLPATLWRDVPFSGIYWSSYELIRKSISGGSGFGEQKNSKTSFRRLATESFIAGSMSGCVAAIFTNGFDVVKTRRQAEGVRIKNVGTLRMILEIGRNEGIRNGLMKGLSPRLAKVIPSCGIMIASYEGLATVFAQYLK